MTLIRRNSLVQPNLNPRAPVIVAGILCAVGYAWLAHLSRGYADAEMPIVVGVCVSISLLSFLLARLGSSASVELRTTDILWFALIFRLIGFLGYPLLEDDHFRYLWDGWIFVEFGNPYDVAPAQFFTDPRVSDTFASVLDGVNYPDVPTVYGPTAQWMFAFCYWLSPGGVWPLQAVAIVADLVVISCLLKWASLRWVLLYAWSGLIVKEFSFTAHLDIWGVACLCMAILLQQNLVEAQGETTSHPRFLTLLRIIVGVLLALAVGTKIFCVVALPFVLQKDRTSWLAFIGTACLIAWPFGLQAAWLPSGLMAMGQSWLFNSPIYLAVLPVFGAQAMPVLKSVLLGAFALVYVWVLYVKLWRVICSKPAEPAVTLLPVIGWLFGLLFLVSPVLNPWYLVWWLVLAVPGRHEPLWLTPWVASVTVFASYVTGINTDALSLQLYEVAPWALWIEFTPVAIALGWDGYRKYSRLKAEPSVSL